MKIAICGSMTFAKEMLDAHAQLEAMGHEVRTPARVEEYLDSSRLESKWTALTNDPIKEWFEVIKSSDAILVLNFTKNGIENYVGGNALMEMAFAHVLGKRIFLLNPIPTMSYRVEISFFKPEILYGDLANVNA